MEIDTSISGILRRIRKLEEKLTGEYRVISKKEMDNANEVICKLEDKVEKLEKTHNALTNAPAVWDLQKRAKKLEMGKEFGEFQKNKIIYEYSKHLDDMNSKFDMAWIAYFVGWLDKNGYEIREKK
jgi:hypothetical protein